MRFKNLKKHLKDIILVLLFLFKNHVRINLKYIKKVQNTIDGLIPFEFHSHRDIIEYIPDFEILIQQLKKKYQNFVN